MPRRNPSRKSSNVSRIVRSKLHQARLTGPPTWYKSPGRPHPPPEIPNSPPYFLKIRVLGVSTLVAPLRITPFSIANNFTTLFSHLSVHRIDAWAQTGDITLAVLPYRQIQSSIDPDRQFYGTGTANSIRPFVSVQISQKDVVSQPLLSTSRPIVDLQTYTSLGTTVVGNFVVDLWCTFTNQSLQIEGLSNNFKNLCILPETSQSESSTSSQNAVSDPATSSALNTFEVV